jgi:hypothetical protein
MNRSPIGAARYRWRSAPEPTDVCGKPLRVRSGGSRVHSPSSPSRLAPTAGSLGRRATGTRPVHSPLCVMWRGVWAGRLGASSATGPTSRRDSADAQRVSLGQRSAALAWSHTHAGPADSWRMLMGRILRHDRAAQRSWGEHSPISGHFSRRWRRGWDSNPRDLATLRFSRALPSTARPPLRRRG